MQVQRMINSYIFKDKFSCKYCTSMQFHAGGNYELGQIQKEMTVAGCRLFPPQYSGASDVQCKMMLNVKTEIQMQNLQSTKEC
jgi:hypothetical protein